MLEIRIIRLWKLRWLSIIDNLWGSIHTLRRYKRWWRHACLYKSGRSLWVWVSILSADGRSLQDRGTICRALVRDRSHWLARWLYCHDWLAAVSWNLRYDCWCRMRKNTLLRVLLLWILLAILWKVIFIYYKIPQNWFFGLQFYKYIVSDLAPKKTFFWFHRVIIYVQRQRLHYFTD